jgi:hypothetical protein
MNTYRYFALLLTLTLCACQGQSPTSAPSASHPLKGAPPAEKFSLLDTLVPLLQAGDFAKFYSAIDEQDLQALRRKFEQLSPEQRGALNYGALVNAGIVTNENRNLFKPDIKKIDHYVDIPNDLKCWMNATLYSIANSSFFDDFLEIDRILEDSWNKRPKANLVIANRILRSLRETIYEIRLVLRQHSIFS